MPSSHYIAMAQMEIGRHNSQQHSTRDHIVPIPGTGDVVEDGTWDVVVTFDSMKGGTIVCKLKKTTGRWTIAG